MKGPAFVVAAASFGVVVLFGPAAFGPVQAATAAQAAAPLTVGSRPFGSLVLKDLDGKRMSIEDYRGSVVLVNFWATWCKPCVEELPQLSSLAGRYGSRGLVVVAVSIDDASSRADIERMAAALTGGVMVWIGATQDDLQRLGLGAAIPVSALVDRDGSIAHRELGALQEGALDAKIEALLGSEQKEPQKRFGGVESIDCRPAPLQPQDAGPSL
jgi:thiol-disulfide isomerase/thioredoxin